MNALTIVLLCVGGGPFSAAIQQTAPSPPVLPLPPAVEEKQDDFQYATQVIVGYRKQCVNGVCTQVPIYAPIEPAKPGHTHEELGGAVCRVCGQSCFMLRAAEAVAKAKGETSNAAIQAEYTRMYGSGYSSKPLFRRWRR